MSAHMRFFDDASLERDGANKKMGETACSEESFRDSKYSQSLYVFKFCICRFNQLWIKNIPKKFPKSSQKQNLNLLGTSNYSHDILFTTIYIAYTFSYRYYKYSMYYKYFRNDLKCRR